MSSKPHPPEGLRADLTAHGNALGGEKYAPVGSSACVALGSQRATQDIEVVVLWGHTPDTRKLLCNSPDFEVEPRTYHTYYRAAEPVKVEILPPAFVPGTIRRNYRSDCNRKLEGSEAGIASECQMRVSRRSVY
ncbi:hypothetical protein N7530_007668 [Penicillium desertorum]|uniref:Uncharacterized protein n=1 Tax=Penicillium desertorum TaxID=1303715 RepID=A0A9W9WMQ8_9EURO|nr:hypothetical protein N7530_007668 [Penicillium desertorum]